MVFFGMDVFYLLIYYVYIEIVNMFSYWLWDLFVVIKCFFILYIKLNGYKDFIVSQELFSFI